MIVVFAGPTISNEEVTSILDCRCLPPVSHGDILQLDLENISAIGIVDGYFEGAPSVWHKEILYAMDQGVHVYGAASMGALRAAELHTFGMQGVGKIFEWYRDLVIEDDDEVAVSHGPIESGYMVASEPMVNIRQTLQLALQEAIISQDDFSTLIDLAKSTFYKQRNWGTLLSTTQWGTLLRWVDKNRVNLKEEDATLLLKKLSADQDRFDQAVKTNYLFEWTNIWDAAYRSISKDSIPLQLSVGDQLVLEQLKLKPARYHEFEQRAVLSWLSCNPNKIGRGAGVRDALKVFREKNNLMTRAELLRYMKAVDLNESDLTNQMERDGMIIAARRLAGDLSNEIVFALHEDEQYAELLQDGVSKKETMKLAEISISNSKVKRGSYLVWYFERTLGMDVPYDIERYAIENGFKDIAEFNEVVMREYLFQKYLSESRSD